MRLVAKTCHSDTFARLSRIGERTLIDGRRSTPRVPEGPLWTRTVELLGSTWLLGVLAAILSWNVTLAPPSFGLDPSWWGAMYMAAHRGMHFGTQVIFTYGPLAFLRQGWLWYGNLAVLGFIYSSALHIALAVSLVWALRRTLAAPLAALLVAALLLAAIAREVPLALTATWCLVALSREPPGFVRWLLPIGGGMLGAIETLVELRSGPVIWAACLVTLLARRDWRRLIPLFFEVSLVSFAAVWFASGQGLGNLPDFARYAVQIVSGYSEAMGVDSTSTLSAVTVPATVLLGIALAAAAALSSEPQRRRQIGAAVAIGIVMFALYKEAVVRSDASHETTFFSTAAVMCGALAFGRRRALAGAVVLGAAAVALLAIPGDVFFTVNPASHVRETFDQVRLLLRPGQRGRIVFFSDVLAAEHYQVDQGTLALLKGHTVNIDPWEAAAAWVYGLDWDPLPVFQNYSAYTPSLDRLDAAALGSPSGPDRILRENTAVIDGSPPTIDGRLRAWDPPATTRAMLCHYAPLRTTARWQVLGKVGNRCGAPQVIATINTRYGRVTPIPVGRAGGIVYAVVKGASVSGVFERARTFLYRTEFRYATINGASKYRLVPGTAADGLLINVTPSRDYPAPFNLSPNVRTIEFTGGSGPLQLSIEWMALR
jgi:hypothetical protein